MSSVAAGLTTANNGFWLIGREAVVWWPGISYRRLRRSVAALEHTGTLQNLAQHENIIAYLAGTQAGDVGQLRLGSKLWLNAR